MSGVCRRIGADATDVLLLVAIVSRSDPERSPHPAEQARHVVQHVLAGLDRYAVTGEGPDRAKPESAPMYSEGPDIEPSPAVPCRVARLPRGGSVLALLS